MSFEQLCIIIPLKLSETYWTQLVYEDLRPFWGKLEILLVSAEPGHSDLPYNVHWVEASGTHIIDAIRAGLRHTDRKYCCVLHADNTLSHTSLHGLRHSLISLEKAPATGLYFPLAFLNDGPLLRMKITESLIMVQSHFLHRPCGQQGLCLSRDNFLKVVQNISYTTERVDLKIVQACYQHKIQLKPVQHATLLTSARRYQDFGWFFTTLRKAGQFIKAWF